ncbi:MAG: 50S ribosomal protein L24 [Candidatus Paceibacterota bacterium]
MKLKKALKKGVTVKVLAGKDKGKTGKVLKVTKDKTRALIEGVNMYKKHKRPTKQGQKGEIVSVPRTIHTSNLEVQGK